jgi:thiol-disulfide isomerase/thioredoxin
LLANLAIAGLVFFGITAFQARDMLATQRQPAPPLQGPTLAGETYELALASGRPVLVYFFAPWCRVCGASADNLVRLRRLREESELEIVAVALDWQNVDELRDYSARHELNIPVVLGGPTTARDWRIHAFPTYYVLDSRLRVARRDLGYSTQLGLWWRSIRVD